MNTSNEHAIEIIKAESDGKLVQWRWRNTNNVWDDKLIEEDYNFMEYEYRVKGNLFDEMNEAFNIILHRYSISVSPSNTIQYELINAMQIIYLEPISKIIEDETSVDSQDGVDYARMVDKIAAFVNKALNRRMR